MSIKTYQIFTAFWVFWDIAFFIRNLVEGNVVFMIVFAVMACFQVATYIFGIKAMKRRDEIEAQIEADRVAWRKKTLGF